MDYDTENSILDCLSRISQSINETSFQVNEDGELCTFGNNELKPLCNFVFRPLEKIMRIDSDGNETEYKYVFEGVLNNETQLKRVEILVSELENHKWLRKSWNVFCEVYPTEKRNYALIQEYIYQSARKIPTKIEYDTIGWHQIDNKWFFLHSEGTIGSTGRTIYTTNTRFKFKQDLHVTPKEAFLESLNMLDICSHKLSYSLLSYLLTSLITTPLLATEELAPNYLLWIVGRTGYGKTTFSTFFTKIYNTENVARPDAHKKQIILPGIKEHKDCVFVIDDYGTSKTKQNEYSVKNKIEDIIRNMTDRQFSSNKISDGMVLITGEEFLDTHYKNESSKKRLIRVKMDNLFNREDMRTYDEEKFKLYTKYKNQRFLPTTVVHYLEWLSNKLNLEFRSLYEKDFELLRTEFGEKFNSHGRHIDSFVHQINAFNFYMSYGKERGFITPEEFLERCAYAKQVFGELLEDQNKEVFDYRVELFLWALEELISTDKIVVEHNGERLNFNKKIYGTVVLEKGQEVLKLDWDSVYQLVCDHINETQDSHQFVGKTVLAKLLNEYNLICFNEGGTTTQFKNFNTKTQRSERCRVINFPISQIPDIMAVIEKKKQNNEFPSAKRSYSGPLKPKKRKKF